MQTHLEEDPPEFPANMLVEHFVEWAVKYYPTTDREVPMAVDMAASYRDDFRILARKALNCSEADWAEFCKDKTKSLFYDDEFCCIYDGLTTASAYEE